MLIIKNFDQLPKKDFDQTPNLTEDFDQLKMSSEIRSTDPLSGKLLSLFLIFFNYSETRL
jgi:hypothetical protein